MKSKIWIGCKQYFEPYEIFKFNGTPTQSTHGKTYLYAIGPFRTMRAARLMRDYGKGNPHMCTVSDCERIARAGKLQPLA